MQDKPEVQTPNTFSRIKVTTPLHLGTVSPKCSSVGKNMEMVPFLVKMTSFGGDFLFINPLNLKHTCRFQFQKKKYQHPEGIWESSKLLADWKDRLVKKLQQSEDTAISMYVVYGPSLAAISDCPQFPLAD